MSLRSKPALGELVTFQGSDGYNIDGILFHGNGDIIVVHIHGSLGNFYQNAFVREMAASYQALDIGFLSINLSSHDGIAEGYRFGGDFEYVGGSLIRFEDCVSEIEGAVAFAAGHGKRVILQGHSLGCDRVVHYLLSKEATNDAILLSPCDSYQLQVEWIAPETVEEQIARLKNQSTSADPFDWVSLREYGLRRGEEWTYNIPITRTTLLSIIDGPPYKLFRLSNPMQYHLPCHALVYIGGTDQLQVWPSDKMFNFFHDRFQSVTPLYDPISDHMLAPNSIALAERIAIWITTLTTR